jgi:hypothetical protein
MRKSEGSIDSTVKSNEIRDNDLDIDDDISIDDTSKIFITPTIPIREKVNNFSTAAKNNDNDNHKNQQRNIKSTTNDSIRSDMNKAIQSSYKNYYSPDNTVDNQTDSQLQPYPIADRIPTGDVHIYMIRTYISELILVIAVSMVTRTSNVYVRMLYVQHTYDLYVYI